ncbi:MAG: hypothetical protein ACSHYF_04920 [Verrucomicrobiaceae bacterium]
MFSKILPVLTLTCLAHAEPLKLPPLSPAPPAAGKRVALTPPEYLATKVHHALYLPTHWDPHWKAAKKTYPLIVEFTGNFHPPSGSTGEVRDAALGFGLSGCQAIWLTLPYISADGSKNEVTWWGDTQATINYALKNVPRTCQQFGADPDRVILCGFSRGAIAVSYLGLHNDEIARLWSGFVTHDHFDGVKEWRGTTWGSPLDTYQKEATARLSRLNGRPLLICQNTSTREIRDFLTHRVPLTNITFLDVPVSQILPPFPNPIAKHPHTDRWPLLPSPARQSAWDWLQNITK